MEAEKYTAGSKDHPKHFFRDIAQLAFWAD
jgi:hypothetical protein